MGRHCSPYFILSAFVALVAAASVASWTTEASASDYQLVSGRSYASIIPDAEMVMLKDGQVVAFFNSRRSAQGRALNMYYYRNNKADSIGYLQETEDGQWEAYRQVGRFPEKVGESYGEVKDAAVALYERYKNR